MDILVKIFKMLLHLVGINWLALSINPRGDHVRALIHVNEDKSW